LLEKGKIEQTQNAILSLHAALVMVEVEAIDRGLRLQAGALEAPVDGPGMASLEFHIGKPFDGCRDAEVLGRRLGDGRFNLTAYRS
jgi:hypothetical protein